MRRRLHGGNARLKQWAKSAMDLAKRFGPGLLKKYKIGSRGLAYASKSLPGYSKFIDPVQKLTAQMGYGHCGGGLMSSGRGLRSAGSTGHGYVSRGGKCKKYCRRRK
jgi:hypothetical protein